MKIAEIIAVGKITYEESYNQTMTSVETLDREIEPPAVLVTLAGKNATVSTFGDGTHGIDIDGKTWAHPMAHAYRQYGAITALKQDVWTYIDLALSVLGKQANICNAARA